MGIDRDRCFRGVCWCQLTPTAASGNGLGAGNGRREIYATMFGQMEPLDTKTVSNPLTPNPKSHCSLLHIPSDVGYHSGTSDIWEESLDTKAVSNP
jgi:hypothetical protein